MSDSDEPFYSGSEEEAYYESDGGGDYTFEQVASPKQVRFTEKRFMKLVTSIWCS